MSEKIKVAVVFGGLSSEHDVSVLTGLEVLEALNPAKYEGFLVYVGLDGQWWVGDALRDRKNYIPDAATKRNLTRVSLNVGAAYEGGRWVLREAGGGGLFAKPKTFAFDMVIPALHGTWGEDGTLQGVLAAERIPFVGGGVDAMALTIHKMWTLGMAERAGLPIPPTMFVSNDDDLDEKLDGWRGDYPVFVKPNYLGSSIGARVAKTPEDARAALTEVFRLDHAALVQRCIPHLVEYNVAVRRTPDGTVVTSAIERPLRKDESYTFKDKYLSGDMASKLSGGSNPGLVNATRAINPPELDDGRATQVRAWAVALFEALDLAGAPRLDFLCNERTGEIWFNEVNPLPGSFGYFLWEAATPSVGYSALLDDMLVEARSRVRNRVRVIDPVANGGAIFPKRGV